MTVQQMIAARAAAIAKGKKILDDASTAKRALTADEQATYDATVAEVEELQRKLDAEALRSGQSDGQPHDAAAAARAAASAERTRAADIVKRTRTAGLPEEVADDLIARGVEGDAISAALIDEMAKRGGQPGTGRRMEVGRDFSDPVEVRAAMSESLVARATARLPQASRIAMSERGREFANHSILDLFVDLARAHGHRIDERLPAGQKYERLVELRSLSTSDFPLLLADAGNKVLLAAYQLALPTYQAIAARKTFKDFKPHKFLRGGDFPNLLEVDETGEFQYGAMGEAKQGVTLGTYGRILRLSRQIMINDDLGAFVDLPVKAARRVAAFENAMFWAMFAENSGNGPTMEETGRALFNTTDNTKAAANAAIDISSVSIGRAAMRKKQSVDGLKLNIPPRYLVTSPDKETIAEQFCSVNIVPVQDSNANPFKGRLTPMADANLTGAGWYLFADPADIETFVYGHLEGNEGPRLSSREGFTTDGMDLRVADDFATGAVDHRGAWYNAGA